MYNRQSNYSGPTTLGIEERWERVLCYAGIWVTGLIFLFVEQRNETVRRHAKQSILVFGTLSILGWLLGTFGGLLSGFPIIGPLFGFLFGIAGLLVSMTIFFAWIILMVLAYSSRRTLFFGPRHERMFR